MAETVIGREQELDAIAAFLEEAELGPSALILSGEAGIGKTLLWETGVHDARERSASVLTCRGVEAEASLSFAALSELLAPVVDEMGSALLPPRRRALEVALLRVEPGDLAPDPHAIGLAVLDILSALAGRGTVVVALDDLQWLDPASAGVLQIALRRLRREPVGLLATVRTGPDVAPPSELHRSFPGERAVHLTVGPLSMSGVYSVLKDRLALELSRPELARVQEATAGNPFFALEFGRELVRTGVRPTVGHALRVPESLRELLGGRLGRLPAETVDVLLQAAALAQPTVDVVAATYGARERVIDAIGIAVREGVVRLDDSRVEFAHPLLASICYEQAPIWKRRAVHRALASAVKDVEERARHLALAVDGPDATVAAELDSAADHAAARGAPAAAAELCELSAGLTVEDPPLHRKRRLHAASFHRLAGNGERAAEMLEQLLTEVPRGGQRADILIELVSTERPDTQSMIELCGEALTDAAGDDSLSAQILGRRSGSLLRTGDVRGGLTDAREAIRRAERADDPALIAAAIAHLGIAESWAGELTPGVVERGVEIERRLGLQLVYYESPRYPLGRLLLRSGETGRARAVLEELEAETAARGDEHSRAQVLWWLSLLEWSAGRWGLALDHATAAYDIAEQTQYAHARNWVGRAKALIEADLGLVEDARASAEEAIASSQANSSELFSIVGLGMLGRIELSLGRAAEAADYLRELPGRLLAIGANDPTLTLWADAIETLVALGEIERARAYLEPYEHRSLRLRSPLAMEGVLRCRGLLAAADGDLASSLRELERTVVEWPAAPWPMERARTLLCLGVVRRQARQKKASREALEQALAIFEELGARLWAERARAELRRISGRAPASDELTETERRVAELAASGRTNREIAAELFMGVSTVEAHLSRVYRKLGIRSRVGLAVRLDRVEAG